MRLNRKRKWVILQDWKWIEENSLRYTHTHYMIYMRERKKFTIFMYNRTRTVKGPIVRMLNEIK